MRLRPIKKFQQIFNNSKIRAINHSLQSKVMESTIEFIIDAGEKQIQSNSNKKQITIEKSKTPHNKCQELHIFQSTQKIKTSTKTLAHCRTLKN